MSSRRVRKGPGRRPMSEKRRQFLELLAQGWSVRGARCAVRVGSWGSRGRRATPGRTARWRGERMARSNSCRRLSPSPFASSQRGSCPRTSGSRSRTSLAAAWVQAHSAAATRRRRVRPLKLASDPALHSFVLDRLKQRWSPQQIARALRLARPDDSGRRVATETIRRFTGRDPGSSVSRRRHRCERGVIIAVVTVARSVLAAGSRNPCSPCTTAASSPPTDRSRGIGKGTSSSAHTTVPRSARS